MDVFLTLDSDSRAEGAETQGILVIEVVDVLEGGGAEHSKRMQWLEDRLRFGKAVVLQDEPSGTAYAGRRSRLQTFHMSIAWMTMCKED